MLCGRIGRWRGSPQWSVVEGAWAHTPCGCFISVGGDKTIHFDTGSANCVASWDFEPVCKTPKAPSKCPAGEEIQSAEECRAAGLADGGVLRNGAVVEGAWSHVPCGCSIWVTGDEAIHFDKGSIDSATCAVSVDFEPVCKSPEGETTTTTTEETTTTSGGITSDGSGGEATASTTTSGHSSGEKCNTTIPLDGTDSVQLSFYANPKGGDEGDDCPSSCIDSENPPVMQQWYAIEGNIWSGCFEWPGHSGENSMIHGVCDPAIQAFKYDQFTTCDCSGDANSKTVYVKRCIVDKPATICSRIIDFSACEVTAEEESIAKDPGLGDYCLGYDGPPCEGGLRCEDPNKPGTAVNSCAPGHCTCVAEEDPG